MRARRTKSLEGVLAGKRSTSVPEKRRPAEPRSPALSAPRARRPRRLGACHWIPALFAFLVYAPTLGGAFVWDDVSYLVDNPSVHTLNGLQTSLIRGYSWHPPGAGANEIPLYYYRPLVTLANTVTWVVSGGSPGFFHFVNLLVHAGVTLLLTLLLARLGMSSATMLLCGCLFAVHPAASEAVAWISGLADLSAALFTLGALTLLLAWRTGGIAARRSAAAALGLLVLLALGSKEASIVLVALIPLLLFLPPPTPAPSGRAASFPRWSPWLALLVPFVLYAVLRISAVGAAVPRVERMDLPQRLLLSGHLVLVYLRNWILPWRLVPEPPAHLLRQPPSVLPGLLGLLVLAGAVFFWIRGLREWARGAAPARLAPAGTLGLGLLLLSLAPVLQWIPTGEIYGARFLYLPSAGLFLLIGSLLDPWTRVRPARARLLLGFLGVPLLAILQMNLPIWKSDLALHTATVQARPDNARALANLGTAQLKAGRLEEAERNLGRAALLDSADASKQAQYGFVLVRQGRLEEGVRFLEKARVLGLRSKPVLKNLGIGWTSLGRYEEGVRYLREALGLDPSDASLHDWLGTAERRLGKREEAIPHLRRAIELDPSRRSAWSNLIEALRETGRAEEAGELVRAFLERFPDAPEASALRSGQVLPGSRSSPPAAPPGR